MNTGELGHAVTTCRDDLRVLRRRQERGREILGWWFIIQRYGQWDEMPVFSDCLDCGTVGMEMFGNDTWVGTVSGAW